MDKSWHEILQLWHEHVLQMCHPCHSKTWVENAGFVNTRTLFATSCYIMLHHASPSGKLGTSKVHWRPLRKKDQSHVQLSIAQTHSTIFSNKTLADAEGHQQMMEIVSLPDRPWKWGNCWAKLLEAGLVLNADETITLIGQGQPPSAITTDHGNSRFCQALSCRNGSVAC